MTKIVSFFICFVLIFPMVSYTISSSSNQYSSIQYEPIKDSFVNNKMPRLNYAEENLEIKFWNQSETNHLLVTYIGFQLKLTQNNLVGMVLSITIDSIYESVPISVWETSYFYESTINYDNAPKLENKIQTYEISRPGEVFLEIPISKFSTVYRNFNIGITSNLNSPEKLVIFSKESGNNAPRLITTYGGSNTLNDNQSSQSSIKLFLNLIIGFGITFFLMGGAKYWRKINRLDNNFEFTNRLQKNYCVNCGIQVNVFTDKFCSNCNTKL